MPNMVYANPFGSYVQGQQAGTENAIQTAEAARRLKGADINLDFLKWYQPLRQQQAQAEVASQQAQTGTQQLNLNTAVNEHYAKLAALGPEAQQAYAAHIKQTYGFDPSFDSNPTNAYIQGNLAAGNIQPTYADPRVGWGTPGGGFARPSAEGTTMPPGELENLQHQLMIEQTRQQLDSLRNRGGGGGLFDNTFKFLGGGGGQTQPSAAPAAPAAPAPNPVSSFYTPNAGQSQQHDFHTMNPGWDPRYGGNAGMTKSEGGGVQP